MLDACTGVGVQRLVASWFHMRFGVDLTVLGSIFFGAYLFAGPSAFYRMVYGALWPAQHGSLQKPFFAPAPRESAPPPPSATPASGHARQDDGVEERQG